MAKQSYYIVALPGDGIGPEVLAQALRVLRHGGRIVSNQFPDRRDSVRRPLLRASTRSNGPKVRLKSAKQADAVLLGAVGHEVDGKTVFTKPGKPYPEPQLAGFAQVILNRQKLDLYANVRPVSSIPE